MSGRAAAPFLAVRGVSKRFGTIRALEQIDIEVAKDELLVVLGPTGAGKTTLLRTIAGLERPDAGSIGMGGTGKNGSDTGCIDITGFSPAARDVALVFQNFSLYPRWTVRKNLEFPLRAPGRNIPEAEIRRRIGWAAELLNITRYLERPASRLSGGEMQRVAIGRAIVRRPRLFLMDEPLTNLDAKLREALRVELVQLRRQLETPMIFVTHDQAEALSMADRIVVLGEGRVLQTGTPREIYERPASPVVALQLGQPAINLLRVRREGRQWLGADGTALLGAEDGGCGERVLGVRPEHIGLDGGDAASVGTVRAVEYIGPTTTLLIDWAGAHVHVVVPRRAALRPGDSVRPHIDAARAVLFPAEARQDVPDIDPEDTASRARLDGASLFRRDAGHAASLSSAARPRSHPPTKEMP
jgi:multiple sugar transport system ATP-binding protein